MLPVFQPLVRTQGMPFHLLLLEKSWPAELLPDSRQDSITGNDKHPILKVVHLGHLLSCVPDLEKYILGNFLRLLCRLQPGQRMPINILPVKTDEGRQGFFISLRDLLQQDRVIMSDDSFYITQYLKLR